MIFWKGWGILVPVIWIVFFLISMNVWIGGFFGQILLISVPSVLLWFVGRKFNRYKDEVIYVNSETGKETRLGYQHTFMFIPFEFWGIIILALNIWWTVSGVF